MDLGRPLVEYGPVSVDRLRAEMLLQPQEFWDGDRASRVKFAGDRPGNAVFFYNEGPAGLRRSVPAEARTGHISVLRFRDKPLFAEIEALLDAALRPQFPDCDVMRVQLAELPPGEVIEPHTDLGILSIIHRMHVPIVTHAGVKFTIGGEQFFLAEGHLYDLNNAVTHSVENRSDVMRVHLMIDMLPHTIARVRYFDDIEEMRKAVAPFAMEPGARRRPGAMRQAGPMRRN